MSKFNLKSVTRDIVMRPPRMVLLGVEKVGKALDTETPIPTPCGWAPLKELQVGDLVFDKDGVPCKVTNVTHVMRDRPCYRVTLKDGTSLIADADHQWEVLGIDRNKVSVLTTAEILKSGIKKDTKYCYAVPVAGALQTVPSYLPIDPYTLGVWLGDGSTATNQITIADRDADILERLKVGEARNPGGNCHNYTLIGIKPAMRDAGLLGNKHIPEVYFRASYEQRVELLRGLMDSDGYISADGKACCELLLTNKRLAEDALHLARTLNIKAVMKEGVATINGRYISQKYRFNFQAPFCPFHTKFKADRYADKTSKRKVNKNAIVSIEPVDSVPVKCIEVDSPSHTYLAGENYTVTHNSTFAAGAPDPIFIPVALEEGIDAIDVPRFPPVTTFEELGEALEQLADGDHDYKTVIIDSASALEPLLFAAVCEEHSKKLIEDFDYGRGYTYALDKWRMLMTMLDYLRDERGMACILIGHTKVKQFNDPERPSYDRYHFDIHEKAASALYRWADVIGFANFSVSIVSEVQGFNKKTIKAEDDDVRYIHTSKSAIHPGGGRGVYGRLGDDVELEWSEFEAAVNEVLAEEKAKKKKSTKKS